jgi:MarR family transcriptional regulator, organic hydroperoxide resistance regulator
MIRAAVAEVVDCYPKVFFACHRAHVRDEATGHVLSAEQAAVLDHLDAIQPTHLQELAAHVGVTASSMSLMIDRLERRGYARRSPDARDARRVNLRLTKAGVRIKAKQKVLEPRLVEEMLRLLSPDERASALTGLRVLARAASELVAARHAKRGPMEARA